MYLSLVTTSRKRPLLEMLVYNFKLFNPPVGDHLTDFISHERKLKIVSTNVDVA